MRTQWTRRLGTALAALLVLLLLGAAPASATPPTSVVPELQDVPFLGGLVAPTAVRFAADGRVFVAEKDGRVLAYEGALDSTPTEVFDVRDDVYDFWDRGLLGMALDPSFATNGYMYLLYSRDAGIGENSPVWNDFCAFPTGPGCVVSGKLIRIHVDGNDVGTFVNTLIQDEWCQQFASHSVGTVAFGRDGKLYVSAGDGANYDDGDWGQWGGTNGVPKNPCNDPFVDDESALNQGGALRSQDVRLGTEPVGLDGAILRLEPATGAPAVGNPNSSSDANARRIIAYGFRNPFRFAFRPGTDDIYAGDVGWNTWEEINRIPTADNTVENFGWPCFEGDGRNPSGSYDWLQACYDLHEPDVVAPFFKYEHRHEVVPDDGCGEGDWGSSVSGIAFHGSGTGYPADYDGALFFADYARNCIWRMGTTNGAPDPSKVKLIEQGDVGGGPVDLQIGPDGDVYYAYLDGQGNSEIRHIRSTGPTASFTVTPDEGLSPLNVTLNASASQGVGTKHFAWDYDGDGFDDGSDDAVQHHTFIDPDRHNLTVRLRVTDETGHADVAVRTISINNHAPTAVAIHPVGNVQQWEVGDQLSFTASGTDPDGDALTYTWRLTLQHCLEGGGCHTHPITSSLGPSATFTTVDHEWPSHLELQLTASDEDDLRSKTTTLALQPRQVNLTAKVSPASLNVIAGAKPAAHTVTIPLMANGSVSLNAPSPQHVAGQDYQFMGWSDGDTHQTRTLKLRGNTVLTARFLSKPGAGAAPAITGAARTRHTLTALTGTWLGHELTYAYQWLRCSPACTPIAGATAATHRVRDADLGKRLAVRVTASNDLGSATQQSSETAKILEGVPPKVRLTAPARMRLGDGKLKLKVGCPSERCSLSARGVLFVKGHKAGTTRAVKRTLGRGKKTTLTVRLSAKLRRTAEKALKAGKKVTVRLDVTAADRLANRVTRHDTVRLTR